MTRRQRWRILLMYWFIQMQLMPCELWVHPLNDLREEIWEFYTLYPDLRHFPPRFFCTYCMGVSKFNELLELLAPRLRKTDVNFRSMISPEQQIVLTLRYWKLPMQYPYIKMTLSSVHKVFNKSVPYFTCCHIYVTHDNKYFSIQELVHKVEQEQHICKIKTVTNVLPLFHHNTVATE